MFREEGTVMRVTCAVREYVRKAVLAKVSAQIEAAEKAKEAAKAARAAKVAKAEALCDRICADANAKFIKEAKKLGLTFISDSYRNWSEEVEKDANRAVAANVGIDDFVETFTSRNDMKAKCNPCAERDEFDRIVGEPARIRGAATAAADRLLFELELGKVAKNELDGMLKELEVKI